MSSTITEKILAAHCERAEVKPGDIIEADVDLALANDITAPLAIKAFRDTGASKVYDRTKVTLVPDHFVPNKDIESAEQAKLLREFAHEQDLVNYFDLGEMGIEHALLPEKGLVKSGDLVIGADSHTCTYGGLGAFSTGVGSTDLGAAMASGKVWLRVPESVKFVYTGERRPHVYGKDLILNTIGRIGVDGALYQAMEFTGSTIDAMPVVERLTMCNMAIEAGGKNGIMVPDDKTREWVAARGVTNAIDYTSDEGADYADVIEFDVTNIEPQVALPHLPSNVRAVGEVGEITIDQAVIGSCTNGWLEDIRIAAAVLKGQKVDPRVRLIVIPATPLIYRNALEEGLFQIILDAGGIVSTPTCGPCLGGHMGCLAGGERAVATTNRNFVGRMGSTTSEVYLANPAVAAASAIAGKIASPDEVS
jgi:3-isopropylmalate/(R)-2-methylmalate dehydratase large subunit